MGLKTVNTRIVQPFDTDTNWNKSTRILLYGEKVFAKTSGGAVRSKTGTGAKRFSELPYDDELVFDYIAEKNGTVMSKTQPERQAVYDTWIELI